MRNCKLAGQRLAREAPGQTLEPTELVHAARAWLFREIEAGQRAAPQYPATSVKGTGDQRRMEDQGAV
jgi:hypothetical protein